MMNVKKYRATTTREALEQIKQDLGENAFVLETKQVRTGGFLGLRSTMQVEVSAAAPAMIANPPAKKQTKQVFSSNRILNLSDDSIAIPKFSETEFTGKKETETLTSDKKETLISALAARVASAKEFEKQISSNTSIGTPQKIETVEISSEAPKVVHPKKEIVKKSPEQNLPAASVTENSPVVNANRELELLRAELREVKFSLGAFANRQNAQMWQTDVDLDLFSEIFDSPFYDVYVELTATGISSALARKFVSDIIPVYKNNPFGAAQLTKAALKQAVASVIKFQPDVLQNEGAVLAVIGATGVGKTTTVAKLAARVALYEHRRVELVTLDTYRIAAVEQLKTYAEIIGAGCHVVRSVFELDAVLRRLPSDATVLIDTTGRSPHDLADQYELSDYLQHRPEIRKCLAIQATTHPIDAAAAIKKFEMYGADCLTVTKMDETMRPGAIIETVAESNLPFAYFCAGQRVPEDLQVATAENFSNRILGNRL